MVQDELYENWKVVAKKIMRNTFLLSLIFFVVSNLNAQLRLSSESGLVFNQYNDVRAPNSDSEQGTLFSFTDDFEADEPVIFLRLEASYTFNDQHSIILTAAPLRFEYTNPTIATIDFEGQNFQTATSEVTGSYQFNTYRASYRYALLRREKSRLELGLTALLRDARIALTQNGETVENTDLGFVPLISLLFEQDFNDRLSLLVVGDALVGPVGRAEDVFVGLEFDIIPDRFFGKVGYRLIEGGANVDQVYNFAFFHFVNVGIASEF